MSTISEKNAEYLIETLQRQKRSYGMRNQEIDQALLRARKTLHHKYEEVIKLRKHINDLENRRSKNLDKYLEHHDTKKHLSTQLKAAKSKG